MRHAGCSLHPCARDAMIENVIRIAGNILEFFPETAKKITGVLKSQGVTSQYPVPEKYDYNLIVVGAGSAGLIAAYIASAVKSKVALIEKHKMGGDCLNTGCVPSKALLRSAKMLAYSARAKEFGFRSSHVDFDFADVMNRVHQMIKKIEPHDSVNRFSDLGVECISGEARVVSPSTIEVNGKTLTTRSIVIATGAGPFIPVIPGLDHIKYYTSDSIWSLDKLPERLVVLGGGPVGCELAQAFARFGSCVTLIEMAPQLMGREDPDVVDLIRNKFELEKIRILTGHRAKEFMFKSGKKILRCEFMSKTVSIEFDDILIAVGRLARSKGFGLEELGVRFNANGTIETNEFLQTNIPNIYCAGDVAGPYQFTHIAGYQAQIASINALFGKFKKIKADYRVIPWATYTDPEVARVGLSETEAAAKRIKYEVTKYGIEDLDRAIVDSENNGFIKVLTRPKTDQILGVAIVGPHAGDIISEYVFAMKHGFGLNKILDTIHIYPTLAEANRNAAGKWKKDHAPQSLMKWLQKFHQWQRS
jgi:pyruvate/2-oxoglutarate dehydrogenase complex dihydrolipoamide dehydrogenase (E3) component